MAPLLPSSLLCLPQSMTEQDSRSGNLPLSLQHLLELETLDGNLPLPLVVLAPGDHGDAGQGPGEEEPPPGRVRAHHLQWLLEPLVHYAVTDNDWFWWHSVLSAVCYRLSGTGQWQPQTSAGPSSVYLSIDYIDLRALAAATGPGIAVSCRRGLKHWLPLMTDYHLNGCSHSCEIKQTAQRHLLHVPIYLDIYCWGESLFDLIWVWCTIIFRLHYFVHPPIWYLGRLFVRKRMKVFCLKVRVHCT